MEVVISFWHQNIKHQIKNFIQVEVGRLISQNCTIFLDHLKKLNITLKTDVIVLLMAFALFFIANDRYYLLGSQPFKL